MKCSRHFLFLLVLLWSGCGGGGSSGAGDQHIESRVLGGREVGAASRPEVVQVNFNQLNGSVSRCTGVVIDHGKVLTAGHCTSGAVLSAEVEGFSGTFRVSAIARHPHYREDSRVNAIFNDVAVLTVESLNLPALPLLVSAAPPTGTAITTYGYGIDESGNIGVLRAGDSVVDIVTGSHLFAAPYGEAQSNACNGDSGAPALGAVADGDALKTGVVGLVSSGTQSDCGPGDVTLYSRVGGAEILAFIVAQAPSAELR